MKFKTNRVRNNTSTFVVNKQYKAIKIPYLSRRPSELLVKNIRKSRLLTIPGWTEVN